MLRRAGAFVAGFYEPELLPNLNDDGEFLRMKWLKWAELESFKRCGYSPLECLFIARLTAFPPDPSFVL